MEIAKQIIREPYVAGVRGYRKRVNALVSIYLVLFFTSVGGAFLIAWKVKLFVTLTQRSNVETLTLAFLMLFYIYLAFVSAPGAKGGLTILYFRLLALFRDADEVDRKKMKCLGKAGFQSAPSVALNFILERADHRQQPFQIPVSDSFGGMGFVSIDGARVDHMEMYCDGSNNFLAYFVQQVKQILEARGVKRDLDILEWRTVDDEESEKYLCLVRFAQNLEKHLGSGPLWPRIVLTAEDLGELKQRLSEMCPILRDEAFLPQWEFKGEHKLPIIPEPLGIVCLTRSEKRVDPVTSMGAAAFMAFLAFIFLVWCTLRPPWVPGA